MEVEIKQNPLQRGCPWHKNSDGKVFKAEEILPGGVCPYLYHSVYPYMLGLLYGAKFDFNKEGDCNVNCPAALGVNVVVKKRDNDGTFDPRISKEMKWVIFAEVTEVKGNCPMGHKVGDRIIFPTCMREHYMCPAAFNNIFPLMKLEPLPCLEKNNLRCPDWQVEVPFSVENNSEKKEETI